MEGPIVVYDACVLYPFYLRDLLVRLAMTGLFRAKWTDEIQDEWARNPSANEGIPAERLGRTRRLMDRAVPDARVTGYENRIPTRTLPDADDRHVLAAAIECSATGIVTLNLPDFPRAALSPHGIEAVHPDDFVRTLLAAHTDQVVQALRVQRAAYRDPALAPNEFIATLDRCGLARTAAVLRLDGPDRLVSPPEPPPP